ncbi:hypothetical protein BO86DRAFT_373247 [Aspergillus japonicus CBS 114.51]|uniref:Zn(2)-C6 fungal-type domain-containing protein n=1 Tax=Aspergillus japonicus CBS 114.51 TaxID=1448312 RepID=A0A8T8WK68_ASPJA|nr:hypothetical protein BO86DRAFT_373247 [Aspergillus japonicus CBS 114.51]RAH76251.1 hypothetical protein BO86DRAFT_373247 [Aspergillus japonicus CBS 114.51]
MKPQSISVCQNCRDRKIGCDGKVPACTQCRWFLQPCPGYLRQIVFVHQAPGDPNRNNDNTSRPKRPQDNNSLAQGVAINKTGDLIKNSTYFRWSTAEELLAVAIDHFIPASNLPVSISELYSSQSLVCASWLSVLPNFINEERSGSLTIQATRALGLSIICRGQRGETKHSHNSQRLEYYCSAIHQLQSQLLLSNECGNEQTVAAIMSLTLAELMMPTSPQGWRFHVRAVAELVRKLGPDHFITSTAHRLFVGFRPLILIEAILSRSPTFLGLQQWQSVPFQKHFQSPMQRLLGYAAVLPSLLHQADAAKLIPAQQGVAEVQAVTQALTKLLKELRQWVLSYQNLFRGPLYWTKPKDRKSSYVSLLPLCFPNALAATALIHCWTFQIICLTQLDEIGVLSKHSQHCGDFHDVFPLRIPKDPVDICVKICQSMDYFLEDNMKVYGPAAAIFPFQIAYRTLLLYSDPQSDQIKTCNVVISSFHQKGFDVGKLSSDLSFTIQQPRTQLRGD